MLRKHRLTNYSQEKEIGNTVELRQNENHDFTNFLLLFDIIILNKFTQRNILY